MPNGEELNDRLEFQEHIEKLSQPDRMKEVALMLYDHCQTQKDFGKVRSLAVQNRWILIGLVILLVTVGVLDASVFHFI